jgi:hypothetical protein
MSLETKIEALTAAVVALTAKIESSNIPSPAPAVQEIIVAPVAAPAMPAMPTLGQPLPPVAVFTTPFSDPKSLTAYVMSAYKAMGPQKGAGIQGVLVGLGYQNINDVKPEHYGDLHSAIEAMMV